MLKKILGWFWRIVEIVVIVYVIFMTAYILCRNKYGFTQFDKYTFVTLNEENSKFVPEHDEGDLLIVRSKKFGIEEGSVIYYYATVNEEYIVRSGVVKSKTEDEYSSLYFLDDEDGLSVSSNRVLGKDVAVYSGKGRILEFLEGRIGFLLFVLLPIMLIFIYRIYDLFVVSKYKNDSEEDLAISDSEDEAGASNKNSIIRDNVTLSNSDSLVEGISASNVVEADGKTDGDIVMSNGSVLNNTKSEGDTVSLKIDEDNKKSINSGEIEGFKDDIVLSDASTIEDREIKPVVIPTVVDGNIDENVGAPSRMVSSVTEEVGPQIINTIPADEFFLETEEETEIL